MPKYWGENYFSHGSFSEVGQKQKTEKKERRKKKERAKVGDNNGQATHGARKPPGPKFGTFVVHLFCETLLTVVLGHFGRYLAPIMA